MNRDVEWRTLAFQEAMEFLCRLRHQLESRISLKTRSQEDACNSPVKQTDAELAELALSDDADEAASLFSFVKCDDGMNSSTAEELDVCNDFFEFTDQESTVTLTHRYESLGKGARSNVYRGTLSVTTMDGVKKYDVAVKMSRLCVGSLHEIDRWMRVVQLWRNLKHPLFHCCYYVGFSPIDGEELVINMYSAHELALGGTLDASLKKEERFTEDVVRTILFDLLHFLCYLHDEIGVVHNDIKPQNILLVIDNATQQLRYNLSDFDCVYPITPSRGGILVNGMATLDGTEHDSDVLIYGTPPYISPESCRGLPFLPSNDVWSLGILTYQLSTGRLPWNPLELSVPSMILNGYRRNVSNGFGPTLDEFEEGFCHIYSDELKNFVKICLAEEASKRPTASELLRHPFLLFPEGCTR
ncbi:putative protein kinase [Trypanosoma cruzi]|uniref:non-specific serine/threonine protein kinase n=2 Tax=Trypanosoma cruzi TaxID=5693 RepID=Q4DQF3_TRYCC|nr:protein kinase, putative [Trypanosoma cruzi]EAN94754.1 protein kinase, putative [Trypanosoma cruzi]PWV13266.1 putative protein kinase [Trypanosoma cruzi]|eukprot:XP_816605.1 protein kinase [Trypanosoma cruzi strain CL Brener]